jgi:hypothetical protein
MADPLGGDVEDPGAPTTYLEDVDGRPLGDVAADLGAPTTYLEDVTGGPTGRHCQRSRSTRDLYCRRRWRPPWAVMTEIRERPPPVLKISMASPLGGDNGDLGASTIYFEDINGGTHGRR